MQLTVTPDLKSKIDDLLDQKTILKNKQLEIKESLAALAEELNVKPAKLNKLLSLIEKERNAFGVLAEEIELLETAESLK